MRLAKNCLQFENGAGLAAFMDNLMVSARSVAGLNDLLRLLDEVLTTVGLSLAESKTFHMVLQWMEMDGRTSYHLRMSEAWGEAHPDGTSEHLAQHGSTTIRRVEVDEGVGGADAENPGRFVRDATGARSKTHPTGVGLVPVEIGHHTKGALPSGGCEPTG